MKKINQFFTVCLLILFSFAAQSDTDFSYLTLQGIKTVAVQVEGMNKDLYRYGFDHYSLTKSIEHKLANSGFKVISREEALHTDAASLIKMKFSDIRSEYGFYSYVVNLTVKEKIPLPRRNNAFISATIWDEGAHGMMLFHEVYKLENTVNKLLESLITEHHQQNISPNLY